MPITGKDIATTESKMSKRSEIVMDCDKRCGMGDRVCHNQEDIEEKEIVKTIPEESNSSDTDSIHSGESLFKTFKFEPQDQDPDMEKCMNFWKSILAKNVKPIKCALTKSKEKENAPKKEVKPKIDIDDEEVKNLWLGVYKDLQKKNLDKIKLIRKKVCDPCVEYANDEDPKMQQEEIKQLNEWKPNSQPMRAKIDIRAQIQRTSEALQNTKNNFKSSSIGAGLSQNVSNISYKTSTSVKTPTVSRKESPKVKDRKKVEKSVSKNLESVEVPTSQRSPAITEEKNLPQTREKQESEPVRRLHEFKSISKTGMQSHKTEESQIANQKPSTGESFCCNCGCNIDECVCEALDECVKPKHRGSCYPCECKDTCACGEVKICSCGCALENCICEKDEVCKCGCGLENCICESNDMCFCGCAMKDCICETLNESNQCSCGCSLEDCICEQLFSKSCNCGHLNCDCGEIAVINAYLESLNMPHVSGHCGKEEVKKVSTEIQTNDENETTWILESTQKEGSYCVICGHFNCNCKLNKA